MLNNKWYNKGKMMIEDVKLSFGELNPIYQEDYRRNTNDMGF